MYRLFLPNGIVASASRLSYDGRVARRIWRPRAGLSVGEFGDKFRKEREKKKISLDDVSRVTKIGTRMLQAIEQEQFDQLPGGVFNKGFIRAYAKHLGLNEEQAVNEYLACVRQAQIEAQEAWQKTAVAETSASTGKPKSAGKSGVSEQEGAEELPELQMPRAEHVRPARRNYPRQRDGGIPWRIVAAGAVVVVLATILWIRHRHRVAEAASASTPPAVAQAAPVAPTTNSNSAASATNAPQNPPSTPLANPAPPTQRAAREAQAKPLAAPPANGAPTPQPGQAQGQTAASQETSSTSTAPLRLVVRATETSWISVTADGQPVTAETLIAPAHTSIRANREIVVKVGNAGGVTFLWNGHEVPAQGAEAEVKTLVFDAQGMRAVSSEQPQPPID